MIVFLIILGVINLLLSLSCIIVCGSQKKEYIDVKNLEDEVSNISSMLEDWIY